MTHNGGTEAGAASSPEVRVTGRRVLATIIDGIVVTIVVSLLLLPTGLIDLEGESPNATLEVIANLIILVIWFSYYLLMEGYLGRTLGKMVCSIKVVREDTGDVPGLGKAALRTIMRLVDGLFFYLVAFITVLISGRRRRLGDMAANTLVVRR